MTEIIGRHDGQCGNGRVRLLEAGGFGGHDGPNGGSGRNEAFWHDATGYIDLGNDSEKSDRYWIGNQGFMSISWSPTGGEFVTGDTMQH